MFVACLTLITATWHYTTNNIYCTAVQVGNWAAAVEMLICAQAGSFIGSWGSTFTGEQRQQDKEEEEQEQEEELVPLLLWIGVCDNSKRKPEHSN